ncbi:MAG: T9SS type A sorting domain-containing protein [Bacteroidetes bacterium]|nr:T9SS type A sorting domain-containing protein [Bacteroidota bacterium]MCZ2132816.1 T9SS type A sorting domain-containing protein [Bacteroidota bacterium]
MDLQCNNYSNISSTIGISNLKSGVYIVKLIDTKGLVTISRVVVVRE